MDYRRVWDRACGIAKENYSSLVDLGVVELLHPEMFSSQEVNHGSF